MIIQRLACALAISLLCITPAWAVPIVYTDRAAFDAAVGNYILLNEDAPHEELHPVDGCYYCSATIIYPGLFVVGGDVLTYAPFAVGPAGGLTTSWHTLVQVTAFGFDVADFSWAEIPHPLLTTNVGTVPLRGLSFFGVVSSTPIVIGGESHGAGNDFAVSYHMSNLAIQPFVQVPEPSTLWLLAPALGLLWWKRLLPVDRI